MKGIVNTAILFNRIMNLINILCNVTDFVLNFLEFGPLPVPAHNPLRDNKPVLISDTALWKEDRAMERPVLLQNSIHGSRHISIRRGIPTHERNISMA
jgi:hypothetical protein